MKQPHHHFINIIFSLFLFGIFIIVTLILILMGATVYANTNEAMTENFDVRTSLTYITEKIRQNPEEPRLETVNDSKALVLSHQFASGNYETWIFFDQSVLREVTVAAGTAVNSGDGQAIMELKDFSLSRENGLLTVEITTTDEKTFSNCIQTGGNDG